jgi:hypothetical protein
MSGLTKDDIIRMANEAGGGPVGKPWAETTLLPLERFATLVAAAEREACAKLAYKVTSYEGIADAIRARGSNAA